ncbi:MAG: hypothetical protein V8S77_01980 [Oscillospiraceae bacterium]
MDLFDITTDVAATLPNSEFVVNEEIPRFHTKTPYENIADAYRSELDQNPSYPYFHYLVNQSEGAEELPSDAGCFRAAITTAAPSISSMPPASISPSATIRMR